MDSFLGTRLKRAREEAGLSQGAFARAVGLSSEYISLLESGKRVPSFETMKRLSAYLGRDTTFFLADKKWSLETLLEGDGVPQGLKGRLSRFKAYCSNYLKAEEATGRRLELAPSYSRLSPERMAEEERRRLGLGDEPIRDLFSLAEMNGLRILRFPLPEGTGVAGVFLFDEETAGAFALLNSCEPSGLQLLAAAHIYGHYLRDRDAGLIGNGPRAVISPWGVYDFHPVSKRMRVKSLTPGVTFDAVQQMTGFELLKPEGEIPETKMVTPEALKIIRTQVDPRGVFTTMPTG